MSFDVNAATARYIDSLGTGALQKAHDYTVGKEWLLLWDLLVSALVTWIIVRCGILDRIEAKISGRRPNVRAFLVSLTFFIVSGLLTLPWSIYESWWREKSYGRTSQPLGDFLFQGMLAAAITAVLGAIFMIGVYWLMRRAERAISRSRRRSVSEAQSKTRIPISAACARSCASFACRPALACLLQPTH